MKAKPVALFWNLSRFVRQEISTLIKVWCLLHHRSPGLSRQIRRSCTVPAPPPQPGRLSSCVQSEGEAGRSNSLLGSRSCQVPTRSASTLQFSQLTGTRTLTHLQTMRPARGHDEFLLLGSFCIAGVLFSFWFYRSQHANNCSVKDHEVLVLVRHYLRISDLLEAQLTCTHISRVSNTSIHTWIL